MGMVKNSSRSNNHSKNHCCRIVMLANSNSSSNKIEWSRWGMSIKSCIVRGRLGNLQWWLSRGATKDLAVKRQRNSYHLINWCWLVNLSSQHPHRFHKCCNKQWLLSIIVASQTPAPPKNKHNLLQLNRSRTYWKWPRQCESGQAKAQPFQEIRFSKV